MSTMILEARTRTHKGKGASRRLRRLENRVPAILYGGEKEPQSIDLLQNKLLKALETESIYSSIFEIKIDGKKEKIVLKDLQRHPYKPIILHMDLQRVGAKDVLVRQIPLHFINDENAKGVKAGGIVSHTMTSIEIRCQAKNIPEYIEVDLIDMELNDVLHLSDIKLPKSVDLATDPLEGDHNHPVVSIHKPKVIAEPEAEETLDVEEATSSESAEVEETKE